MADRTVRWSGLPSSDVSGNGARSAFERDRDRVLYSDYFRRLAGVTQVASAADAGLFHNRLLHSLKVAQVARRLAQKLLRDYPELSDRLDADVVEAAALAHDLGHPPFGHVAEKELQRLAEEEFGLDDGFEGNAQTFRILVRLANHSGRQYGLDLCRATLDATLKYPWLRLRPPQTEPSKRRRKYSVYDDDVAAFQFVRDVTDDGLSIEAQVMDLADSITYSVHDLEDFYRAGLIPVERIRQNRRYFGKFMNRWKGSDPDCAAQKHFQILSNIEQADSLLDPLISEVVEPGSQADLELVEKYRSTAITHFLSGVSYIRDENKVSLDSLMEHQCKFLHRMVRDYVIESPRLATQQAGQIDVVQRLSRFFRDALLASRPKLERIPVRFRQRAESCRNPKEIARFAIDIVASLSEAEATLLFGRVNGYRNGSLMDVLQ